VRYAFIAAEKANYGVSTLCRRLGVSRGGYYAWLKRGASARTRRDAELGEVIESVFVESRRTYGRPRIAAELRARGVKTSEKRIARLMRQRGLVARPRRRFRPKTTDSSHGKGASPNLLEQRFNASAPNEIWCSDITYLRTESGFVYLCVVLDLFTRAVVGWSVARHMRAELVLRALEMAEGRAAPQRGLVVHSDRGSQYASDDVRRWLKARGFVQSMSRKGNCYDNAPAESFFSTLEFELVMHTRWTGLAESARELFDYIEIFYNRRRLHSALGFVSPLDYENGRRAA